MKQIIHIFIIPIFVLLLIFLSILFGYILPLIFLSKWLLFLAIFIGSLPLFKKNFIALLERKFALDYIALLAIIVAVFNSHYLVAAIIVLMLLGGTKLEEFGVEQAKKSLTKLTDRMPNRVLRWKNGSISDEVSNDEVKINEEIFIRKGEVIPLDGVLVSDKSLVDESSLTGEPYPVDKLVGDVIRSGTINIGEGIVVRVTRLSKDSTYTKIVEMVRSAQQEKAPLIRLADKYSIIFTLVTLLLAAIAYFVSHDISRVLAVLVIATPCPLILATPIALMGGVSASAKWRIIMKRLSSIEVLSRVNTIVFDKTGTITLGKPFVRGIKIEDYSYSRKQICSIAGAIERNSLHPLAKAIVDLSRNENISTKHAQNVKEEIGSGISGDVDGSRYFLSKIDESDGMAIKLVGNKKTIAIFEFEDKIKANSKEIIQQLKKLGLMLFIFTGDKQEAANSTAKELGEPITVKANFSPKDKKIGIENLRRSGKIVAMIGDGINDAPALASADVGMVFSNEEQTAATDAADVVFLGGDLSSAIRVIGISKNAVSIALQSIIFGIGASILGMGLASAGFINPIEGAFIQEIIDVLVIFNALRASKLTF